MQYLSNGLHGCKVFSKFDLVKGYHQITVHSADIPKTAIIKPFCLFEYLFTPFGLPNASQTFQRMMDRTVVDSPDGQTHLLHLEAFFQFFGHQWSRHQP
jgi:hypothetical protein